MPDNASAVSQKPRGLFITPVRAFVDGAVGSTRKSLLTVANITDKPVTVTMSVERFSISDYSYDYIFSPMQENWITMDMTQFILQPGASKQIAYSIIIPRDAIPGGHYFTLFASTILSDGTTTNKVRAATVLYVTVAGSLQYTSEIIKESIPWITFGGDIEFTLDVKNTGNTHFFTYTSGKLAGWTVRSQGEAVAHLLLPGTVRTIGNTVPSPVLPGIYRVTYGYKTDYGTVVQRTRLIAYLPPWSIIIPLGGAWLMILYIKYRKRRFAAKRKMPTDF